MIVVFFGHKDTPCEIMPRLEQTIQQLIKENENITFLVGTHGAFDKMVQKALKQALNQYPHINCRIVLAYLNDKNEQYELPTLFPEGIECKPKRFAIDYRNDYMVKTCDTVVCYIDHDWGGAAKFVDKARRKGKNVINIHSID